MYSVNTEEEAESLIIATCELGYDGQYYSRELMAEQSLPTLYAFGDKLHRVYQKMLDSRRTRSLASTESAP